MNQLKPVQQKLVDFNGTEIMAIQTNDKKIFAGVKSICQGLKLDPRRQKEKLQSHLTLSKGVATLTLPTNGGMQETLVIDIDFLPLWLASINPALVSEEVRENLLDFQLKAKDVLASAFIKKENVTPLSKDQALVTVLRTTADLVEKQDSIIKEQHEIRKLVSQIDNKVEEQITLDHGEQRRLQKAVASKVYELSDDPKERSRLFREIYREIKDRFAVASYKDVKRKELQAALNYIENWIPKKVS
ncbi:phage antirepressor N-terminal domain-containing protein [Aeribacillus pallidus]|uniref:phage antirepressor N-terminal domain-containing protein n=1 Tax=Aeribacillus pallidus TaxID=33936 RepID=UPI0009EE6887|nr:phage antirepressor N-terminal domain-containing protein [Aeribacillus pallidus]